MSITLEEAQNLVVRYAPVLNEEYVPLAESVGRRLTSDIRSAFPQPPFDRSPPGRLRRSSGRCCIRHSGYPCQTSGSG